MKKYYALLILLFAVILIGFTYESLNKSHPTLAESKTIAKVSDDFILHAQVNDNEEGVEVLHSLQYTGNEKVKIQHQTPLVSVSFADHNHDFTGSYVIKTMEEGNIYYPQKDILSVPESEECNLYMKARFDVDGERKVINHTEKLEFH